MTSKQVMLTLAALLCLLAGCDAIPRQGADPLVSPYAERRVWAVAPLRNETGSLHADGLAVAEHLVRHLEGASNIDALPLNRTLAAMEALGMGQVATPAEAMKLLGVLQADALVVGSLTAYDPYDPPKLGMALELYTSPRLESLEPTDVRALTSAAVERGGDLHKPRLSKQPVNVVSAVLDAGDADVRRKLERYAADRRMEKDPTWVWDKSEHSIRQYRMSMDLFSEFAGYVMSWRLLKAESDRLAPPPTTQPRR
jgi:hypothetical protein